MIIVVIIIILYFVWFQLLTCFHLNPRFLLVFFFQKWCKRGRKSVSKPSCQLRLNHNRWKKASLVLVCGAHVTSHCEQLEWRCSLVSTCVADKNGLIKAWCIKKQNDDPAHLFIFGTQNQAKDRGTNTKPLNLASTWINFSWVQLVDHKIQMWMLPQSPQTNIFTCAEAKFSFVVQLCERDWVMSSRPREPLPVLAVLLWELCNEGKLHPEVERAVTSPAVLGQHLHLTSSLLFNRATPPSRMKKQSITAAGLY